MSRKHEKYDVFSDAQLNVAGLNLQAVLGAESLTPNQREALAQAGVLPQGPWSLILFGNGGPGFWRTYQLSAIQDAHPVDTCSRQVVDAFMARRFPGLRFHFLYPGAGLVPLQALGRLAGWHHDSPMKVGINDHWGLWFAYRALVLVEADLPVSPPVPSVSPCDTCRDKPCIAACPALALEQGFLQLDQCVDFRLKDASVCEAQCLARLACPVAAEHRYDCEQVSYHYRYSLPFLRQWRDRQRQDS